MRAWRAISCAAVFLTLALAAACARGAPREAAARAATGEATSSGAVRSAELPPDAEHAQARLAASPRHAEWVVVRTDAGDSVRAWVVHPERAERAPVVLVVHEIFGLSHWIRAVADQLAADGFLAVAPDLLTMHDIPAGPDGAPEADAARAAIRTLDPADVHRQLRAVAEHAVTMPAALPTYGIVGFCWGGEVAFRHAAESPALAASVVYYGPSPDAAALGRVRAPVLGLYGEDDARVNATIPAAEQALRAAAQTYETHIYPGAGHGFLRQQTGREGANLAATRAAWPETLRWFRTHLQADGG